MPLYVHRRKDNGALEIAGSIRPPGAEKSIVVRRRPSTNDPKLAQLEAQSLEQQIIQSYWLGERPTAHTFLEAAESYLRHEPRTDSTKAFVRRLLLHFQDMPLSKIGQEQIDKARDVLLRPGASPATVKRNVIVPLRAILTHAAKRKWCERPYLDIPSEPKGRTRFLTPEQVERLVEAAAPHLKPLLTFLVGTGCRLGEALSLEWEQVDLRGARALLLEEQTKSGDRRVVALPPAVIAILAGLPHREGSVFRSALGKPYRSSDMSGGQIRTAWATACRKAGLPGEWREWGRSDRRSKARTFQPLHGPHDLRHSWASWFYALHKDLLLLKQTGGWKDVQLVERYAHLMPVGHEDGIRRVWGLDQAVEVKRQA